jgi:hypothetical protein
MTDNCYELDRLIREQARDMKSRHVSKDRREISMPPMLMDELFDSEGNTTYSDRIKKGFSIAKQAGDGE